MASKKPNIVIMYADDLGFGDVGCYGGTAIATPNIDRLAASGVRFTDGYATAATCTPSRYSLLTGEYPWRNSAAAILPGDAPLIIRRDSATVATVLRDAGYQTGVVGKWHLGIGGGNVDWNRPIDGTPNDVGFEYSYIMAATNDRVPCVYLENRDVVGLEAADPIEVTYDHDKAFPDEPTGRDNPELLKMRFSHGHDCSIVNGVSRIGYMRGGKSALWTDEDMADVFLGKAVEFVEKNAQSETPFFLYYAFHQPHVPRLPHPRFVGATGLGPRGDVIVEMDWCLGQMLDTLERLGIAEDTVVVFTSDNGPVLDDGYEDQAAELTGDHKPAGPLRGGKYSRFDGGTRVPFIVRSPVATMAGTADAVSSALVSQVDFCASFAALAGAPLAENAAVDSMNVIDALIGKDPVGRADLVTEGMQANTLLRSGSWAYLPASDGPRYSAGTGNETGLSHWDQLYDLSADIGQRRNVAEENPDRVAAMDRRLKEVRAAARTR
ncbi:MAG: arylsulfatase [Spirochaetaceae bacterium]|nr:MAG: arylsulfatase [Spirochaetaceae bacterium]